MNNNNKSNEALDEVTGADENKKSSKALPDEVLDRVSGGAVYQSGIIASTGYIDREGPKMLAYVQDFARRNCYDCSMDSANCILLLSDKEIYTMFGGDPNARCQFFSM